MAKSIFFLFFLPILLVISGFFDAFTYLQHSNMLSLEANPLVNLSGSIILFIVIKLIINLSAVGLFWITWKYEIVSRFKKFTITYLIILFLVYQIFGGVTNIMVKEQIKEDSGYDKIDEIPKEIIETQYTVSNEAKLRYYLDFAFISMILPLIISLVSFKVWEKLYF